MVDIFHRHMWRLPEELQKLGKLKYEERLSNDTIAIRLGLRRSSVERQLAKVDAALSYFAKWPALTRADLDRDVHFLSTDQRELLLLMLTHYSGSVVSRRLGVTPAAITRRMHVVRKHLIKHDSPYLQRLEQIPDSVRYLWTLPTSKHWRTSP